MKEFLYQLFTFLITKSQAGNTLIRELLCVFPYKFCFPPRVICIKRLDNFTLQRRENEQNFVYRNSLHILGFVAANCVLPKRRFFCRFSSVCWMYLCFLGLVRWFNQCLSAEFHGRAGHTGRTSGGCVYM